MIATRDEGRLEVAQPPIEAARLADAPGIARLLFEAWPDCIPKSAAVIAGTIDEFLVTRSRARIGPPVGVVALHRLPGGRGELRSLAVDRRQRGRGHAAALVDAVIGRSRRDDLELFCVTRRPSFFARHGFKTLPITADRIRVTPAGARPRRTMRHRGDVPTWALSSLDLPGERSCPRTA